MLHWIQRRLDGKHAKGIASYLEKEKARLFGALVLGVYAAQPEWSELRISDPLDELSDDQEDALQRTLGLLRMKGHERLFAIDGQHRVAGIKLAIKQKPILASEEVAVLLVGHMTNAKGRARTRRLFTTLNQKAKKVTAADLIALDEDNGFAVVTRKLVDGYERFSGNDMIALQGNAAVGENDKKSLTTIIGLYEVARELYPRKVDSLPKKLAFTRSRPSDSAIQNIYDLNVRYWDTLFHNLPEYTSVFSTNVATPDQFRSKTKSHLLFRPIGQSAFGGAVRTLVDRGWTLNAAVKKLLSAELSLLHESWHHILWDPARNAMITKNRLLAESWLLTLAGEPPESDSKLATLNIFLQSLDDKYPLPHGNRAGRLKGLS